ncbi:SRPBCC family protein [Rhizobium terrae]|uniref:SRPBCC family protein n=1 Tax=Rhizobium terrae TaxID=2171756 RepID=UPI000E3E8729|nr:SRPBCC family protein [Rhizobium terrae]
MFQALHRDERHTIRLPFPIDACFPLFTPEGERRWVPDWQPLYLHPPSGETTEGMVFTTGHGGETTLWCLIDLDEVNGRLRYSRLTPGSRSVIVHVRLDALSENETELTVEYSYTGLSEHGNAAIEAATGPAFTAMIESWKAMILEKIAA